MRQTRMSPNAIVTAVSLLAGVSAVQWLPALPSPGIIAGLAAGTVVLGWRYASLRWLAVVLLGFAWAAWRGGIAMEARLPKAWDGQTLRVTGQVDGLAQARGDAASFLFHIAHATLGKQRVAWHGETRVSWYGHSVSEFQPCSHWRLELRLRRPRGMINPGGADGERSALARGITAVGYVRTGERDTGQDTPAWCLDRLRASLASDIQARVSDAHDAALLRAFTVGDTRGLDEQDWEVARANGVSHLIAISGFHVGVAAIFGAWLCTAMYWVWPSLGARWPRVPAQALSACAFALVYAGLAGFGMPTVRTVLMIAVVAAARCCRRASSAVHVLALTLIMILLVDPMAVLVAGFWLSFVGVGFLIACLDAKGHGLRAFLRELTAGQLVMTVALLPLTLWFFGEASLVGAFSNLIAVPVVSFVIVPVALMGLLLLLVCPPLAGPVLRCAGELAHMQWWLLEQTARWPGAHWFLPAVQPWALLLAMLGAAWLFMPRGAPLRWLGALLFLPLVWPVRHAPAPGAFQAWVLDVGQGLSVIVQTHSHVLVYDTGARYPSGFDLGQAVVVPSLHALGIDRLNVLMVSHADNDHAGGAQAVVAAFPAARRYSGEPDRMPLATLSMKQCLAGQRWKWDDVSFRVLSPTAAAAKESANDHSCVLLVQGDGGRLLLTGDIAMDVEPLVASAIGPGPRPVLQVPHHGSKHSSSAAFIAAVRPQLAVVSAGWKNRFGHPRPEVLRRYAAAGVPVLNTALDGAIQIDFPANGTAYVAGRWRVREQRYWRE